MRHAIYIKKCNLGDYEATTLKIKRTGLHNFGGLCWPYGCHSTKYYKWDLCLSLTLLGTLSASSSSQITMFSSTFLVTVLAITVTANPVVVDQGGITLELSRRVNATSVRYLLEHDQERAKALWSNGARDGSGLHNAAVVNQPVINQAFAYIANVGIGSPATNCVLQLWQYHKDIH